MKRLFCIITILAFMTTLNLGIRAENRVNRDGNDITHSHWEGETWKVTQSGLDSDGQLSTYTSSTAAKLTFSHFLYAYASFTSGYEYKVSGTWQLLAKITADRNPDGQPYRDNGKIVGKKGGMHEEGDHEDSNWFSNADPRVTFHSTYTAAITEVTHPTCGCKFESNASTPDNNPNNIHRVEEKRGDSGNDGNGDTDTPALGISVEAGDNPTYQPGDSITLNLVTSEAYYQVDWYVHTPWDTSSSGTYQQGACGDGTSTETSFSYTFPSGSMHTGNFTLRAVIFRWSDMSWYGDETYTVTVE